MCDEEPDYAWLAKHDPKGLRLLVEYWGAQAEHNATIWRALQNSDVKFEFNFSAAPREESPTQKAVSEAYGRLVSHSCRNLMKMLDKPKRRKKRRKPV